MDLKGDTDSKAIITEIFNPQFHWRSTRPNINKDITDITYTVDIIGLIAKPQQTFKEQISIPLKLLKTMEREGILQNFSYGVSITLIPKSVKCATKRTIYHCHWLTLMQECSTKCYLNPTIQQKKSLKKLDKNKIINMVKKWD